MQLACDASDAPNDAAPDAVEIGPDGPVVFTCDSFPGPSDPLCPAVVPFCCPVSLESPAVCSAETMNNGFNCREHPIGGQLTSCDRTTGDGCPVDRPVCCEEWLDSSVITYCSDHAFIGPGWTCSP